MTRFELATSASRTQHSTKLSHIPTTIKLDNRTLFMSRKSFKNLSVKGNFQIAISNRTELNISKGEWRPQIIQEDCLSDLQYEIWHHLTLIYFYLNWVTSIYDTDNTEIILNFLLTKSISCGIIFKLSFRHGEVSEWFKEPVLKTGDSQEPWVRIPPSPPKRWFSISF